jgi:small neutral amino acid transporter SnatA (MarC family)
MSSEANQEYGLIMFLITILVTFFSVDFMKILGAKKLQPLVTRKRLTMLNRLIGIIFAVSGMSLIVQGLIGVLK